MQKVMAGILLILLGFSGKAFGDQVSTAAVVWPDYSTWTVVQTNLFQPFIETENQNYPNHLVGLKLEIGTAKLYLDNPDSSLLGVWEVSVLGNGVVLRSLMVATPVGVLNKDLQLLVNGKWVSGVPGSLHVYLVDPKKWLCKGELGEVFLMLKGKPMVKLFLQEKR